MYILLTTIISPLLALQLSQHVLITTCTCKACSIPDSISYHIKPSTIIHTLTQYKPTALTVRQIQWLLQAHATVSLSLAALF